MAGDRDGNSPYNEMSIVVAPVVENDGSGPAVFIMESAVLVSLAAVSPRQKTVISYSLSLSIGDVFLVFF